MLSDSTRGCSASCGVKSGCSDEGAAVGDLVEGEGHKPPMSPATTATRARAATPPPIHRRRLAAGEAIASSREGEAEKGFGFGGCVGWDDAVGVGEWDIMSVGVGVYGNGRGSGGERMKPGKRRKGHAAAGSHGGGE